MVGAGEDKSKPVGCYCGVYIGLKKNGFNSEFYVKIKTFHELMLNKVREILLVSSPYDAFIIEEGGSLASRIINEYRGLNLSMPPRVTRTSSPREALEIIGKEKIDIVLCMPHLDDMDAFSLGLEVKKLKPDLPVILLAHSIKGIYPLPENNDGHGVDKIYVWSGNSDLLLAIVKNVEDHLNVERDTRNAKVRVLILVEDSPVYCSSLLPFLYKIIVKQTQTLMVDGINEEHRLLKMRARPKILVAENYEEALDLYEKYRSFLIGVISDNRFPLTHNGKAVDDAGIRFTTQVRKELPDLPILLMSSESGKRVKAETIPAVFLDKNSPNLLSDLHGFTRMHLGFGDFIFRMPDGTEYDRASDLGTLAEKIPKIPDASLWYHAERNHFSSWIMARSEISLALEFRDARASDFNNADEIKEYIISGIRKLRQLRQKGVVAQFSSERFDAGIMDFVKIGQGSLGGKGRSLAFISGLLHQYPEIHKKYSDINIQIPRSLGIAIDVFEEFIAENRLAHFAIDSVSDEEITQRFLEADLPEWLQKELGAFLDQATYPLSVRSSSLLEDAHFQPYAGLYQTYMIPNNDPARRLKQLMTAIKRVYASTYYESPKAFSRNTSNNPQEEAMAVIIQELVGKVYGEYFYPTFSGIAQSYNFYPFAPMVPEDGIAVVALGFGKTVVDGEKSMRFSPRYPNVLPQFSTTDDTLKDTQRLFYALKIKNYPEDLNFNVDSNLVKREVLEAEAEFPVKILSGTYIPEEHRIRDSGFIPGPKVLTFPQILKYNIFPLPQILSDFLEMGRKGLGCPVEIEFSVNLSADKNQKNEFFFLQIRPMVSNNMRMDVQITPSESEKAFCRSFQALGNGSKEDIADIVYIKPADFKAEATLQMVEEISRINTELSGAGRPYLMAGPGRWGSSDRWLGIPVRWQNVHGVGAIIELRNSQLKVDSSQGSHFFHNIVSLGIPYLTVTEGMEDFFDWNWLESLGGVREGHYVKHARLEKPLLLKIDGRSSQGVILRN